MKKINIIYWITTGLILALMLWSAIGSFMDNPESAKMMAPLGYKPYVFHFLAVAKILGIIAILVPGYPRLKEWAYAGFMFDMLGAFYAGMAVGDPITQWLFVIIGLVFVFGSYIYYHKLQKAKLA